MITRRISGNLFPIGATRRKKDREEEEYSTVVDLKQLKPWQRPELTGLGRLPTRPPLYASDRLSLDGTWEFELHRNPEAASERVDEILSGGARSDSSQLETSIPVPSNWTREGFDKPHYTNIVMPWREPPPHLPAENPAGLYRRTFSVPPGWGGRRLVLHVGGAESTAVVWVNRRFIGVTKDSRIESEFDITAAVDGAGAPVTASAGEHEILVMVVRYSDGSYIEDQDQWWMAGIHRSVFIYSTPPVYLQDLFARVQVELDDPGAERDDGDSLRGLAQDPWSRSRGRRGTLTVDLEVGRAETVPSADADLPVEVTVRLFPAERYDGCDDGPAENESRTAGDRRDPIAEETVRISGVYGSEGWRHDDPTGGHRAQLHVQVEEPLLWSSEAPFLYRLEAEVCPATTREQASGGDGAGDGSSRGGSDTGSDGERGPGDVYSTFVGFRTVEVRERQLRVNGRPVLIRGVNRHEHDPRTGKVISRESMIADLKLLKQFNFNAVRTAHYPNCGEWYDLCDRYGIYLVDEANLEAHHYYNEVCRDPAYAGAFLDRTMRMVLRDRNHPSVILWSLGNESGYGPNHDAAAGWVRHADPTRPLHYEGAIRAEWGQGPFEYHRGRAATDVIAPMYAPVEEIVAWAESDAGKADPRPLILCEYSHAMGNSNGGLEDYAEAFRTVPGLQGGFIWDWVDQGLEEPAPNGTRFWAYGGDFGDTPNDRDFCINGLIWPDRTPHPAMWEFRKLFQPVRFAFRRDATGTIHVTIRNELDFTPLEQAVLRWDLTTDGTVSRSVETDLPVLTPADTPGGTVEVSIDPGDLPGGDRTPGETILTVRLLVGSATDFTPRDHQLAWEQWTVAGEWNAARALPLSHGRTSAAGATDETPTTAAVTASDAGAAQRALPLALVLDEHGFPCLIDGTPRSSVADVAGAAVGPVTEEPPLRIRGPVPSLWRAPTDNDFIRNIDEPREQPGTVWYRLGLDRLVSTWAVQEDPRGTAIVAQLRVASDSSGAVLGTSRFVLTPPGAEGFQSLLVEIEVARVIQDLPRVGVRWDLPSGFETVQWYGRGPQENYPDRGNGYPLRRWTSTARDQYVPYIVPQEHGGHGAARYVRLVSPTMEFTVAAADRESFHFSALHTAPEDLDSLSHTWQVRPRDTTILTADLFHRGLGTAACGPDCAERYRRGGGSFTAVFLLRGRRV